MGWFNKSNKEGKTRVIEDDDIPELPQLPELPDLPDLNEDDEMAQLPTIPSSSLGQRFSQNVIKEAISGKRGNEKRNLYSNEFTHEDEDEEETQGPMRTIPRMEMPQRKFKEIEVPKINTRKEREETYKEVPVEFKEAAKKIKNSEPVFIRIDKFQKALEILEETKEKISDMRKTLNDIRRIKEEEETELSSWEAEINKLKAQIDKIDSDLFSKVE